MTEQVSFVEVLMGSYHSGDREYSDWFEEADLCSIAWEDATEEIPEVIEAQKENERREAEAEGARVITILSLGREPDLLVTQSFFIFQFRCFGQSFDRGCSSGIEWYADEVGHEETFADWLDELARLGLSVIEDKKAQGLDFSKLRDGEKFIRFVTLWSYNDWRDSYNNEFNCEWYLLGLVNPNKAKRLIEVEETT